MDSLALLERRLMELAALQEGLHADIENCQRQIATHKTEIEQIEQAVAVIQRLSGARWARPQPRIPKLPANVEQQEAPARRMTVRQMIEAVLTTEGHAMRPAEIDRAIRSRFQCDLHEKQVGKECCRLFDEGHLTKDALTKEYDLPSKWGSDQPAKATSLPHYRLHPAEGREAGPGGLQ